MKTTIGLQISDRYITALQLKKSADQYQLEEWHLEEFSDPIFLNHKIHAWEPLKNGLKNLRTKILKTNCRVTISIPASLVNMQKILLPETMASAQIPQEIQKIIDHSHAKLGYYALDYLRFPSQTPHYNNIFFAVTHQEYLQQYLNCVEEAGFHVKIVDVHIFAMLRALQYQLHLKPSNKLNKRIGLLCINKNNIQLMVIDDAATFFYRQIDYQEASFDNYLNRIIQSYQLSFPDHLMQDFIICSAENIQLQMEYLKTLASEVYFINSIAEFSSSKNKIVKQLQTDLSEQFVLRGLAMRVLPAW